MAKTSLIKLIKAKEILDSKGKPTVEVELVSDSGRFSASVPSGVSTGKYEAVELAAEKAVNNVNKIIGPKLAGKNPTEQKEIDEFLIKIDGTENKSKLGANAILAVSIAVSRAGAKSKKIPLWKWISLLAKTNPKLPVPGVLLIEGGLHGKGALDIQEFMIAPQFPSFKEGFKLGVEIFKSLGKILDKKYGKKSLDLGVEGAFTPLIKETEEVLGLILSAVKQKKAKIILDIALSHSLSKKTPQYYLNLVKEYPILGLEDPFGQDDWQNWQELKERSEKLKVLVIGDDLLATNLERMKMAKERNACNTAIIKPNQVGTVTETIAAAKLAKSYGWKIMVSHRGGETMDDFIADLAVGLGADYIKAGAPTKKERMIKYNRLLKIEQQFYNSRS
ncbi:MAG: enolase [bacterium]